MHDTLQCCLKSVPILCIEDEDGLREMIVQTLHYYFDRVHEASNGEEGYDLYQLHKPKIILCDIQMPKLNGIDLVKKIRKNDDETTIIMLTAYSSESYLLELINAGVDYYILKPLNLKKLDEALLKYVKSLNNSKALGFGCVLDPCTRSLLWENGSIPLRKREFVFLELLYAQKGRILTYEQIESELWPSKSMTAVALKSFIKELRMKIPVNLIKNIPQSGYSLVLESS
jgi:DNA-binding response OmpR family regulator